MKDYYCSQKFDWLEIRLYDGFVASCCQAKPDRLTRDVLASSPTAFFNWPNIVDERKKMLNNERIAGCESSCWKQEDQGSPSRRNTIKHTKYTDTEQIPKTLNLVVNNTCSLSCSYCCKNFSSSWLNDVVSHGSYNIPGHSDRYNVTPFDLALQRTNQQTMDQTDIGAMIMQQIKDNIDAIDEVIITGGEPLLYRNLEEVLDLFADKQIQIFTGLGVAPARVEKMLPLLLKDNIRITVSAENTGAYHEFNRFGVDYATFSQNLDLIKANPRLNFASTISNLTVFDFANFANTHHDVDIVLNYVFEPSFLHPRNMDTESKYRVIELLENLAPEYSSTIAGWVNQASIDSEKQQLKIFLERFTKTRRGLDVFPQSFLNWLD